MNPVLDEQPQVLLQVLLGLVDDFGHEVQEDVLASYLILFSFLVLNYGVVGDIADNPLEVWFLGLLLLLSFLLLFLWLLF